LELNSAGQWPSRSRIEALSSNGLFSKGIVTALSVKSLWTELSILKKKKKNSPEERKIKKNRTL